MNAVICGLLQQLAAVQTSTHRQGAYERAGAAILALDEQVDALLARDGELPRIPLVGPSSLKIVTEVLDTGRSPTVERAVAESKKAEDMKDARLRGVHCMSRARMRAVLADASLDGPSLADYHGDFQMHSDWSDGRTSLAEMAEACASRGYQFSAITDHSHRLPGDAMVRQRKALDDINRSFGSRFRYFAGIEANIRADGTLDITTDDARALEIVVASPHAKLRLAEDQTARMVTAVESPGVHILGHPTGRKWGTRAGIQADWDAVFRAAARRRVAIELDGDPMRQDLDFEMARRAMEAGCLFALDSDAHAPEELSYSEFALAHARLAGIPKDRIINCWSLEQLMDFVGRAS
jgi:histidinol phosphatase-like PHP family hydrolase